MTNKFLHPPPPHRRHQAWISVKSSMRIAASLLLKAKSCLWIASRIAGARSEGSREPHRKERRRPAATHPPLPTRPRSDALQPITAISDVISARRTHPALTYFTVSQTTSTDIVHAVSGRIYKYIPHTRFCNEVLIKQCFSNRGPRLKKSI